MKTDVHFSSKTEDWATPEDFFRELDAIFHFDLDACATDENAKCSRFYTRQDNALGQRWAGTVWMNPPYGRQISVFMKKAYEESQRGATVVCLVPSRTDTDWWHRYAKRGQVIYIKGRFKFGGSPQSAPFPVSHCDLLGWSTRTSHPTDGLWMKQTTIELRITR